MLKGFENITKPTQRQRVIDYVERFGSITALDAFSDLGIMQLCARLCELKKLNYTYSTNRELVTNRLGEQVSIVRYSDFKQSAQMEMGI